MIILPIIAAFLLVFLNGFFVAAEFAMVKLRTTKLKTIQENEGLRGVILAKIHNDLDNYLSACQIGITLASLGLGWIGEPAFAHLLKPLLGFLGIISEDLIAIICYIFAFSVISFLHIVVGELMPKTMAISQAERISLLTALPLHCFFLIMFPFIYSLNKCAFILLKIFKLDKINKGENTYSVEELKLILSSSHLHAEIEQDEIKIITRALDFTKLLISDLLQPIEKLIALDIQHPIETNLALITKYHYSRYPVYQESLDNIIGIIHTKDCLADLMGGSKLTSLNSLIRPVLKINTNDEALDLLPRFQEGMTHFALVYQEQKIVGFVTLDNLLQALIGKIKDEFHFTK